MPLFEKLLNRARLSGNPAGVRPFSFAGGGEITEVFLDDFLTRARREERRREQLVATVLACMAGMVALSIIVN